MKFALVVTDMKVRKKKFITKRTFENIKGTGSWKYTKNCPKTLENVLYAIYYSVRVMIIRTNNTTEKCKYTKN